MRTIFLVCAALCSASLVRAHDFWLEPSSFEPESGARVTVTMKSGHALAGEIIPRPGQRLEEFALISPSGTTAIPGLDGRSPAGIFVAREQGAQTVIFSTQPRKITLPAKAFEDYLRLEGLDAVLEARRQHGDTERPGNESYTKYAKCLLRAGVGGPPQIHSPVGHRIEIVPDCDPTHPNFDGAFSGRVLIDGKGQQSILVSALDDPNAIPVSALTGADGRFSLSLPKPGIWLLKSVYMAPSTETDTDWESRWASLIFQYKKSVP